MGHFLKSLIREAGYLQLVTTTLSRLSAVIRRWGHTKLTLENRHEADETQKTIERVLKNELELTSKDLERISLGDLPPDVEWLLRTEELEEYIEMRKMTKKDKKLAIQKKINETREEQQEMKGSFQIILEEWVLLCKGWITQ